MSIEKFENIIRNATFDGMVYGDCKGVIDGKEFRICSCGGENPDERLAYLSDDENAEHDTYYKSFDEAISCFVVGEDTIEKQIDKLECFEFIGCMD